MMSDRIGRREGKQAETRVSSQCDLKESLGIVCSTRNDSHVILRHNPDGLRYGIVLSVPICMRRPDVGCYRKQEADN